MRAYGDALIGRWLGGEASDKVSVESKQCSLDAASEKKYFRVFLSLYNFERGVKLLSSGADYAKLLQSESEEATRKGVAACVEKCKGSVERALYAFSSYIPAGHREKYKVLGVVSAGMHGTVLGLDTPNYVLKLTLQNEEDVRREFDLQREGYKRGIAVRPVSMEVTKPWGGVRVCSILMERVDGTLYDILRNAWEWSDSIGRVRLGLEGLFESMAKAGFHHTDLHIENIGFVICRDNLHFVALDFDGCSFGEEQGRHRAHMSDVFNLLHDLSELESTVSKFYMSTGQSILDYARKFKANNGRLRDKYPDQFSGSPKFRRISLKLAMTANASPKSYGSDSS
jgi:hypothetical protein